MEWNEESIVTGGIAAQERRLRAILASLQGCVETLEAEPLPRASRYLLNQMQKDLEELRVECGLEPLRANLHQRDGDLASMMGLTMELLEPRFAQEPINLVLEIDEGLPEPAIQQGDLDVIIINLVLNSLQARSPHADVVNVVIKATSHRHGIQMLIRDDGEGIAESVIDRIFQPFVTASGAEGASGLGLVLASEAALRGDATLELHSNRPGRGATFKMFLAPS